MRTLILLFLILPLTLLFFKLSSKNIEAPLLDFVSKGRTAKYHYQDEYRQDLSASAYYKGTVLFGYDGGNQENNAEIRGLSLKNISQPAALLEGTQLQKDIEGAAFTNGRFIFASSLSKTKNDTKQFEAVTSFKLTEDNNVIQERVTYLRDKVLNALSRKFKNPKWWDRVSTSDAKRGGLNLEALSASHKQGDYVVIGLRSPLWDNDFGDPKIDKNLSLKRGNALLIEWINPYSDRSILKVKNIDLSNEGIRGMEYIPGLGGYLIISGTVEKSDHYNLWFLDAKTNTTLKITESLKRFKLLCRPESILHINDLSRVYILSEDSGEACAQSPFNYIEYKY